MNHTSPFTNLSFFLKVVMLSLSLSVGCCLHAVSQQYGNDISEIWHSYYQNPDSDITEKTFAFLNEGDLEYEKTEPPLIGFYGALFKVDSVIRNQFIEKADQFKDERHAELFQFLFQVDIDAFYADAEVSPFYNDMNWASFFATGDVRYLDNIIANVPYAKDRKDLNLFLTGGSAKWSLASNASQHDLVKSHLQSVRKKKKYAIKEILTKDPYEFREEMIAILKEQKAKGVWN